MTTRVRDERWPERTMLVMAHPGHELRIWGWLERVRPGVLVVTDGSGRCATPRIGTTERLLRSCGARPAGCFGVLRDRELYAHVLRGATDIFRQLADTLTRDLIRSRVECVVGDAAEGQILAHDLVREVRRVAVRRAEAQLNRPIAHYEYSLDCHPTICPPSVSDQALRWQLDAQQFARKLAAARGYAEMTESVQHALTRHGESAFVHECLFPCTDSSLIERDPEGWLGYERHGAQQVARGVYREAVSYAEHVRPILRELDRPARSSVSVRLPASTCDLLATHTRPVLTEVT